MFMLCGPIRHAAQSPANAPQRLEVFPQRLAAAVDVADDAPIQTVFAHLAQDTLRSQMIAAAVCEQYRQGRHVLVLTERTDHLESLQLMLEGTVQPLFVLHGRLGRKARAAQLSALDALASDAPRVVLRLAGWLGKVSTTRRWIHWCWLCRSHGKAPCSSTPVDFTESMRVRRCAGPRLRGRRPSGAAAYVGEASAWLSSDGISA